MLAAEAAGQRPRGLTTLFALPGALALVDPRLATPPGIAELPALAARWKVHRAQTAELLSDAVIDALASGCAATSGSTPARPDARSSAVPTRAVTPDAPDLRSGISR